jgi:pyrimidine deaminase RibD-like protein
MIYPGDIPFIEEAIKEAKRCPRDDPRIPRLAALLVRDGREIARVYRCELHPDEHAEYMLLRRKLQNPSHASGATLYVTLEPCSDRRFHEKYDKKSCAEHIIESKISRVIIGTLDPNPDITYKGFRALQETKLEVELFPVELRRQVEEVNADFLNLFAPHSVEQLADQYLSAPAARHRHALNEKKGLEALVKRYDRKLYSLGRIQAPALQLLGAGEEAYTRNSVHVELSQAAYKLPDELHERKSKILGILLDDARTYGAQFFDGPCVRLLRYRFQPSETTANTTEEKHLWLQLGPVGWFDYSIANHWFSRILLAKVGTGLRKDILRYLDLERVAKDGALETVRLSNIVSTATTLLTIDGYVIYSMRSSRVSTGQSRLTSAVAENIHRHKDQFDVSQVMDDLSVPFRTVVRGIKEEVSQRLGESLNPDAIYLLGICFDLDIFHPDLLFLVVLPIPLNDFWAFYKEHKGVDFHEGDLEAVRPLPDEPGLFRALSDDPWIPSGQASLIRAVQFIQAVCSQSGKSFTKVVEELSNGRVPCR